ncbi:hypothetical protein B0O99DRAFT_682304 [Bisporella sp. PMI_857]|nr:hypothetical protein B0O99DRAFT_682304 [Bisporella sp. PMI_857]
MRIHKNSRRNRGIWRKDRYMREICPRTCKDDEETMWSSVTNWGYCSKHKGERDTAIARFEYMPWKELMEELRIAPEPKFYNLLLGTAKLLDDNTLFTNRKRSTVWTRLSDWAVKMLSEHEGTKQWFETYGKNLHSFTNHVAMAFLSQASNGRELLIPDV